MERHTTNALRPAFTLVEILVVIAIIGILMGLALVGINAAVKNIKANAIAMEITSLSTSIESYKTKHGSYPPDGSSATAFESHFRSVYPNIAASEFTALYSVASSNSPVGVMDPAEALVFCLGGFSKSPTNPFTGPGGPLAAIAGGGYQYNIDRNEPLFDFAQDRLTLDTSSGSTISSDEGLLGAINAAGSTMASDVLPVYIPKNLSVPMVYFSAGSYRVDTPSGPYFNFYASPTFGAARPYKSDQVNTKIALSGSTPVPQRDRYYMYMNDKTFQIQSAGLDDNFGGSVAMWPTGTPRFFRYPSGTPLDIGLTPATQPTGANYAEVSGDTTGQITQTDNVTNFAEGALSNALP